MALIFSTHIRTTALRLIMLMSAVAMLVSSCDSVIYDEEGDCEIHYRLRFRFEKNLSFTDAFSAHVHSVAVYAFNPDGTFAWMRADRGAHLATNGYTMSLDGVPAGDYHLVAWCGMDNGWQGLDHPETFTLPELTPGVSTEQELQCRMEREYKSIEKKRAAGTRSADDVVAYSNSDLWPLFHGMVEDVTIIDPNSLEADGQTITYNCDLTKNTNRVRVILQQLSGEDIDVRDFTFRLEMDNGLMDFDNSLVGNEPVVYEPHNMSVGFAGLDPEAFMAGPEGTQVSASDYVPVQVAIADFAVARLVEGRRSKLTIYNSEDSLVAGIPLIDYALLVKDNYNYLDYVGHHMTEQDYLDREDSYTLTFFLDRQHKWGGVRILINSWRVVIHDYNVGV